MEPRIQYAKTSDGVSIAYSVMGEGAPLVIAPNLNNCHLQMGWQVPWLRAAQEQLAQRAKVISFDCRGTGMSQRDAMDFSLDARLRDLEAVTNRLELEHFALLGRTYAGDLHFAYAAQHGDRVRSLVHYVGTGSPLRPNRDREMAAMRKLAAEGWAEQEWEFFNEIFARVLTGWDSPDARPFAALLCATHSPESYRLMREATDDFSLGGGPILAGGPISESPSLEVLASIRATALILHCLGHERGTEASRRLASDIPSAQVAAIPGPWQAVFPNEIGINAILDFIDSEEVAPGQTVRVPELNLNAVRTILITDIEGHTPIMERLGDAKGRDVLRENERLTREALAAHGGAEVKAMGDGFMAWFPSAQGALDCAVALQRGFALHNREGNEPVHVRVGVNAGEPIADEDDLFGTSVIAAARICKTARGGEILVADVVRQLVAGKGFLFADRGDTALRGFEDPVRLYEVRWREA